MIRHVLLGAVQGVTEFLPVSSSGHLVIAQRLLGIPGEELILQLVLHLGTLIAVAVFLRREIAALFRDRRLMALVLAATAVTGTIGMVFHDFFEQLFSRPEFIAPQLAATGIVVLLTGLARPGARERLGLADALIVGVAQALAIIPALSRSGLTIAALMFRGVDRKLCFAFSFLISVPAIIGASVLEMRGIEAAVNLSPVGLAAGFLSSFAFGLAALWLLKKMIINNLFHYFGYYCLAMALALFFMF